MEENKRVIAPTQNRIWQIGADIMKVGKVITRLGVYVILTIT